MRALMDKLKGARQLPVLALVLLLAVAALLYMNAAGAEKGQVAGTELELRMARVLSQVQGAGEVRVLLRERESAAAMAQQGETQLADGAVIVAEGAGDIKVQLALQRAAKALLGVPLERIEVLQMDGRGG